MSKILNLGIDISLHAATCCLLGQESRLYGKVFNVDNNLPGFETLKNKITEICRLEGYDTVRIGLEATGMYGFHLLSFFSNTRINGVSFHIYQINAKYINRFKKVFSEKEKTDVIDARVVAEYLKFEMLPVEFKPDSPYLPHIIVYP